MSVELGPVRVLGADAVGQPGQRRFRLFVQSRLASAVMWMEKEQLNNLSLVLDRSLALLTGGQVLRVEARAGGQSEISGMPEDFPGSPTYEFQVGRMKLSYDERQEMFLLDIVPLQIVMDRGEEVQVTIHEEEAISFIFNQREAQNLSGAISAVVSAGRRVCPFCHLPLDGEPHACAKQNGHHVVEQEEGEDEE